MSSLVNVESETDRSVGERMDSPVKPSILTGGGTDENEGASTLPTSSAVRVPDNNSWTKQQDSDQRDNDCDVRPNNRAEQQQQPCDFDETREKTDTSVIPNTEQHNCAPAACERVADRPTKTAETTVVDTNIRKQGQDISKPAQSSRNSSSNTQTYDDTNTDGIRETENQAEEADGGTEKCETKTVSENQVSQGQNDTQKPSSEASANLPQHAAEISSPSPAGDSRETNSTSSAVSKSSTLQSSTSPQKREITSTTQESESKNLQSGDLALIVNLPLVENSADVGAETVSDARASPSCSPMPSEDKTNSARARSPDDANASQSVYSVKWVLFKNNKVPIITQNENGPCPLIAIMNVLLLKKKIHFPAMMEMVTSDQLMSYLGECIFDNAPKNITEDSRLNYEQNMHDAMAVFHKLQTGLDVNVRFTGVRDFEYTTECIIFDLLEIRLYHGWMVDPQEPQDVAAVGNCSYNQLVEKIIAQKSSDKQELVTEALVAETFLESSAAQLTYHGLCELSTTVKEEELCVFFRNNHFSTLHRHKGELFLLVTDQGFLTEPSVVWETLSNVEGDCHFVDASFHTYTKPELAPIVSPEVPAGSEQQIDQDYLVALSLQQEQQLQVDPDSAAAGAAWNNQQPHQPTAPVVQLSDHEIAMRLQEEEDRRAATAYAQQQQQAQQQRPPAGQPSTNSGGRRQRERETREGREKDKEKDSCLIL